MSPEKYNVEVISPTPDFVQVIARKVHVKVRATGRTKVVAVRAQAFRQHAPPVPEYYLAIAGTPHVYEGDIPAYPIGTFGIKVLAEFEGQPTVQVPVEAGPFEIPLEAGSDQVSIEAPTPGPVSLGMAAEFDVQVFAQGGSNVEEVRAKAYTVGGPLPGWDDMDVLGAHPTSADRYVGTISGFLVPFRIKAKAKFVGEETPPLTEDDKGNYSGS